MKTDSFLVLLGLVIFASVLAAVGLLIWAFTVNPLLGLGVVMLVALVFMLLLFARSPL